MDFISEKWMGEPVSASAYTLYPISNVNGLIPEGTSGGWIWNRPHAVLVRGPNDEEHILRIRDITRERQILILGFGLLGALALWLINRKP